MMCRELVSVAELSESERQLFTDAILALKQAPSRIPDAAAAVVAGGGVANRYDDYVWMHSTVGGGAHFGPAFGPWHREFLRQFEHDLRQVMGDGHIVIPYWDWTTGRAAGDANWPFTDDLLGPLGDATGLVTSGPFADPATFRMNLRRDVIRDDNMASVPDTNLQLRRRPASVSAGFNLPTAATARTGVASTSPYDASPFNEFDIFANTPQNQQQALLQTWVGQSFRKFLEWALHNGPHTWVGGQDDWPSGAAPTFIAGPMSIPAVSPNDPVFWLHHCNVDRLWSTWQQRRPPGAFVPVTGADAGHNRDDEMVHFEAANAAAFDAPLRSTPADVVDSRGQLDIWYTSDLPLITLLTPSVDFGDVPADLTTDWPVKFDVRTCRPVKFRVTAVGGANFSAPAAQGDVVADHDHHDDPTRANVFLEFHAAGASNVVQPGTATIEAFVDDTEGYYGPVGAEHRVGTFPVTLSARPVPAPRAAIALVLDRSGSMAAAAGPAGTRYDLLQSALRVVAAVLRDDDAIGLVSYDDVVDTLTPAMLQMGASPGGPGRQAIDDAIDDGDLVPRNTTAIGQGMIAGAALLGTVQSDADYATKAMVVMTDGNENVTPYVTDPTVTAAISWFSDRVYAIGLGNETDVSAPTLGAIARYQLITGDITTNEQRFLLTKYFLQILAGITDNAIVVDPQGELRPGDEHRVPFDIADSDVSFDLVAMSPLATLLDVSLVAPDGTVVGATPNVRRFVDGSAVVLRVGLPAVAGNAPGSHAGKWTAVLRIGKLQKTKEGVDRASLAAVAQRGALPWQVFVQAYSNLKMAVEVRQDAFAPGSKLTLFASILEYRQPLAGRAQVVVDVTEPDGNLVRVRLKRVGDGRYEAVHTASRTGVYHCRFLASGTTRKGVRFQREDTRTAAINARLAPGGDLSVPPRQSTTDGDAWCRQLACLVTQPALAGFMEKQGIDVKDLLVSLKRCCATPTPRKEPAMSDDTKRLHEQLTALRAELKRSQAFESAQIERLFAAAPEAVALCAECPPGKHDEAHHAHDHAHDHAHGADPHAAHHNRALPLLAPSDEGGLRLVVPGTRASVAAQRKVAGTPGKTTPKAPTGHDHGDHDHGTVKKPK